MSQVLNFENVSKKFILSLNQPRAFQELFLQFATFRRRRASNSKQVYWAMRDVNLSISAGEAVGIIGPNGAGKSTLLKLASRIIFPTSGQVCVDGRVAALLELGAGFHPDLTGRENIYLNGSILGMNRDEIHQKIDEIIDFSELGYFINMPVKHYSSGMYMRLGFSIVVHVDPDILLIDEILAVGDAVFQQKCLNQINQLRKQGKTIVFVSHHIDSVRRVCERVVWVDQGKVQADGPADSVIDKYIWKSYEGAQHKAATNQNQRWGSRRIEIDQIRILDENGNERQAHATGKPLLIEIHYKAEKPVERPVFGLALHRSDGVHVTGPNTRFGGLEIPLAKGSGVVQYVIPSLPLLEGLYYLSISCHDWDDTEMFDYYDRCFPIQVIPSAAERFGLLSMQGTWKWAPDS